MENKKNIISKIAIVQLKWRKLGLRGIRVLLIRPWAFPGHLVHLHRFAEKCHFQNCTYSTVLCLLVSVKLPEGCFWWWPTSNYCL